MNRKTLRFAALVAALCLALTGCNLIGVDPLMQLAEDRAAVEDIYETVLAEYDGGTVTVADIIYDFNLQWSYYYQIYEMYGMELDDATVTALRERGKALGLRFYPLLLYIATRAINANREFRMGFNEHGAPGYWDFINPSYTIFHDDDKTFSDVWSEYDESFPVFYQNVLHDMETYKDIKGVRAKPGRPANCCPMSALPWLSFTGLALVQATEPPFLPPIITFGKYFAQGPDTLLPIAVSVHHAAADGYHTSKLINDMQALAASSDQWMRP